MIRSRKWDLKLGEWVIRNRFRNDRVKDKGISK